MTVTVPDGRERCPWGDDPELRRYHDEEWGTPLRGDDALFERLCLEAFQSGLSWITILRKRPAFRVAFAGFAIDRVAEFGDDDVERLLADPGIVRNRAKILACVANARVARELSPGLDELLWSFAPPARPRAPPVAERRARRFRGAKFLPGAARARRSVRPSFGRARAVRGW